MFEECATFSGSIGGMAQMSPATERAVQTWAGNVLRLARAKKGLSQRDLATAAGVPASTIAKIESGHRQPTHPTLARILASIDLALTTRIEPYDDHDDVSWEREHRRNGSQQREAFMGTRLIYRLRPSWRPRIEPDVFVPADLTLLTGKTSGILDPPVNLYWQPGELDFGTDADLRKFYSSAISSLTTAEEFAQWIDAGALTRLWPQIALPSNVRKAWETIHPPLRTEDTAVNVRLQMQDTVLEAIADLGFELAGGSTLLGYDIVARDTDDIDPFLNATSAAVVTSAVEAVIAACDRNGWTTEVVGNQKSDKKILVTFHDDDSTVVHLVHHHLRSTSPERHPAGLRLIFSDVVGGKGVAVADASRGRDFDDLARIVDTSGWSIAQVEAAMRAVGNPDLVSEFQANIARFRDGEFDQAIRDEGFEPAYAHAILDKGWRL